MHAGAWLCMVHRSVDHTRQSETQHNNTLLGAQGALVVACVQYMYVIVNQTYTHSGRSTFPCREKATYCEALLHLYTEY